MSLHLSILNTVNEYLEQTFALNRRELADQNVIRESQELVYRVGTKNGIKQKLPFKRLYLPMAHTGILEPLKPVDDSHRAIQILLPGAGTTFSVAETLCDVAGTFHGKKSKNRGKGRKTSQSLLSQLLPNDPSFKIASFPIDLPLLGMGTAAPFEFVSQAGMVAVVRHIYLVLSHLYPGRPIFLSGRSTGGVAAILYAQQYDDVAGVIAVNPPHPDSELMEYTINYLEEREEVLSEVLAEGVSLHNKSWEAFKTFTPTYDYPSKPSLSPVLVMASSEETLNLHPRYDQQMKEFEEGGSNHRVHFFSSEDNNLWNRKVEHQYRKVVGMQVSFMLEQMEVHESANQNHFQEEYMMA